LLYKLNAKLVVRNLNISIEVSFQNRILIFIKNLTSLIEKLIETHVVIIFVKILNILLKSISFVLIFANTFKKK